MKPTREKIAVCGLWHLGCTLCAAWSGLGHEVTGIDPDEKKIRLLNQGRAVIFEPGLDDALKKSLKNRKLRFSSRIKDVASATVVFVSHDTPIDDSDRSLLGVIEETVKGLVPHFRRGATLVMSAQLPVGAARRLRALIQGKRPDVELAYSPENLRLGEALACYLHPGHVVIGAENPRVHQKLEKLFKPMRAEVMKTNLPTSEMIKHGINSQLAVSVTLTNQLADLCDVAGADVAQVIRVMRMDPRIGPRAYLAPGPGFSGGTLGRDLQVLEGLSRSNGNRSPLFGKVWRWNHERFRRVRQLLEEHGGSLKGRKVAVLGLTYKPGTSTLRRSLPLKIALDLQSAGARVSAYDPQADYSESREASRLTLCDSALEAARNAHGVVVLTGWPEFLKLDWRKIRGKMKRPLLVDPSNFLQNLIPERMGFHYIGLGRGRI